MRYALYRIMVAGMELTVPILLVTPVFILWCLKKKFCLSKSFLLYAFMMYLFAVLGITGFPSLRYLSFEPSFYLIPFVGMVSDISGSILNVLLFIPLGFFLPFLCRKNDRLQSVLLFGFCMSLSIEALQMFTYRLTDINDIITNCVGTGAGYCISRLFGKPCQPDENGRNIFAIITVTALFMFAVQPYVLPALWQIFF